MTFSESKFLADIPVSNTRYKYHRSQNNNLFHLFKNQYDYAMIYNFVELETIELNIDKFLSYYRKNKINNRPNKSLIK